MRAFNPEKDSDKLRVNFTIHDKEKSVTIFKHFLENQYLFDNLAKVAIFLQKPESVFVRYGDIEAEKFKASE